MTKLVSYVNVDYEKIQEIIEKRGTTRAKCADAMGVHRSTIGNSIKRNAKMRLDHLQALAKFLDVKPADLIKKDELGNPAHYADWERALSRSAYASCDEELDEIMESSMQDLWIDLNEKGRDILYSVSREVSDLLHKLPQYLINASDDTPDEAPQYLIEASDNTPDGEVRKNGII